MDAPLIDPTASFEERSRDMQAWVMLRRFATSEGSRWVAFAITVAAIALALAAIAATLPALRPVVGDSTQALTLIFLPTLIVSVISVVVMFLLRERIGWRSLGVPPELRRRVIAACTLYPREYAEAIRLTDQPGSDEEAER